MAVRSSKAKITKKRPPQKAAKLPGEQYYSATEEEQAAIEKALKERKIPPAPRLKVDKKSFDFDHPDRLTGSLLLRNALGTLDISFASGLLSQLAGATSKEGEFSEPLLNFFVSVIKGIEPRDQLEAMLAAQMACINKAMLESIQHLNKSESIQQWEMAERSINKLARTYALQMETLKRYRSGGEQKVTVQHVNVAEGGQAIVGNISQAQPDAAPDRVPPQRPAIVHDKTLSNGDPGKQRGRRGPIREGQEENHHGRSYPQYRADA